MDTGAFPRGEVGTHLHEPDRRIDRDPPPPEHIHLNPRPKVSPRNICRPRHAPKRKVAVGDAPSLAVQKARAAPIVLSLPSQQDLPDPLAIRVERSHRSTPPPKRFPTRTNCCPTKTTTLQSLLYCQTQAATRGLAPWISERRQIVEQVILIPEKNRRILPVC